MFHCEKMAVSGGILNTLNSIHRWSACSVILPGVLSQVRQYAARKGTREKARKKKVKVEVKKLTFLDKMKLAKKIKIVKPDILIYLDGHRPVATDDVYYQKHFQYKKYPFAEAIQCHRECLHPTMYNAPDEVVKIFVELNMQGIKKTKPVETFRKIVSVAHPFDHGEERKIMVFCKSEEDIKAALDGGATLAGSADIVKLILSGEISVHNYDTVLAHPVMMPEILTLRGILKKKHPNLKAGTLSPDIKSMIQTHMHGIKYVASPYDQYPEYGRATIPIGKLNMDIQHLEANLQCAIDSVMSAKPKRPGSFITRIRVECPPSVERLKIDHTLYIKENEDPVEKKTENVEESDDEEDKYAVAAPI